MIFLPNIINSNKNEIATNEKFSNLIMSHLCSHVIFGIVLLYGLFMHILNCFSLNILNDIKTEQITCNQL